MVEGVGGAAERPKRRVGRPRRPDVAAEGEARELERLVPRDRGGLEEGGDALGGVGVAVACLALDKVLGERDGRVQNGDVLGGVCRRQGVREADGVLVLSLGQHALRHRPERLRKDRPRSWEGGEVALKNGEGLRRVRDGERCPVRPERLLPGVEEEEGVQHEPLVLVVQGVERKRVKTRGAERPAGLLVGVFHGVAEKGELAGELRRGSEQEERLEDELRALLGGRVAEERLSDDRPNDGALGDHVKEGVGRVRRCGVGDGVGEVGSFDGELQGQLEGRAVRRCVQRVPEFCGGVRLLGAVVAVSVLASLREDVPQVEVLRGELVG